ncbi:MAG: hypothetical protein JWR84_252 [Caulobacter sp.]|nr:hypothetical protein [Caulobacter sp.]
MTTQAVAPDLGAEPPPWRPGRRSVDGGLMIGMMAILWFFLGPGYAWWLRVAAFLYTFGSLVVLLVANSRYFSGT